MGVEKDGKDQLKTNEEVLQMVQEERNLMGVIWRRKKNWVGHIAYMYSEAKTI